MDDSRNMLDVAHEVGRLAEPVFGKYRGIVVENEDPEKRGRLKVHVPTLLNFEDSNWALPCLPFGGAAAVGHYFIPPKQARVWIEFEQGNIHQPIWTGTYWTGDVEPPATDPKVHALQTPGGHRLCLDDTQEKAMVTLQHSGEGKPSLVFDEKGRAIVNDGSGAKITLDADAKKIIVTDANQNSVTMSDSGIVVEDKNGNAIKLEASGMTLKASSITLDATSISLGNGASEPVLLGQSFLQMFMTHTHPTAMGPTMIPIPTGSEMMTLSQTAKTK